MKRLVFAAILVLGIAGSFWYFSRSTENRSNLVPTEVGRTTAQGLLTDLSSSETAYVRDYKNQEKLNAYLRSGRALADAWDGVDRLAGEPTNSTTLVNLLDKLVGEVHNQVSDQNLDLKQIKAKLEEGKKNLPPPPTFIPVAAQEALQP